MNMRVPIEIDGLEKYIKGFNENSLNLLVGSANSSKTLLGLQFLAGGSKKREISKVSEMKDGAEKGELSIESIILKLTKEFDTNKYDRIVLDSLTILRKYGIEEERKNLAIHQLIRFFIEKKVTAILTVDSNIRDLSAELLLSDEFIILNKEIRKSAYYRTLQILKMRGTIFDFKPHELIIDQEGINVKL